VRSKRFYYFFPILFALANIGTLMVSFFAAHYWVFGKLDASLFLQDLLILSIIFYLLIEILSKDYKIGRSVSVYNTIKHSIKSTSILTSMLLFMFFFSKSDTFDRTFLGTFFVFFNISFALARSAIHIAIDRYRLMGNNFRNAVIIGHDKLGISLFETLNKTKAHGIRCIGFYSANDVSKSEIENVNLLGTVREFLQSKWNQLDFVYLSSNLPKEIINEVIERADNEFIKVKILPSFATIQTKLYTLERFNNLSIINVNDLPLDNGFNRFLKRIFDIFFSSFVLIFLLSWMYPIIALIIYLESGGPIIFRQKRHGQNNRIFNCYKFRTMMLNDESDSKWATRNDTRVTKFGIFLRRTSLDELPQFFNVLIGEMAVVGPRPHAVEMNEYYKNKVDRFYQRHAYKPGITGLAQSMGYRGEIVEFYHIKNRVKLDRFYFRNWSFLFDIKIVFKTIIVLLKGQEAAY